MPSITLDVVYGEGEGFEAETINEAAASVAGEGVTFEVITEHGPGGGWPVITFTGERPALLALIERYDADQLSFFATRIEG